MSLRPFANLFCVFDAVPERLNLFERALAAAEEFDIWRPAEGWVAAVAPLPNGPPEPEGVRAAGLVFCEGADRVVASGNEEQVARLACHAPDRLAALPGDFTFVAFAPDGQATAVRSCGGLVPVYHWRGEDQFALGTRLDYFVRFLPKPPELDAFVTAIWTSGWAIFPDRRTFLRGVSILDRGHYLQAPGLDAGRYWDPRPEVGCVPKPDPEHPRRLREILITALSRDLSRDGTSLLTLSGGVDSSAVGALAAGTLGLPVAALTFLPPDPECRRRDEHYVDVLASSVRFHPHWRVVLDTEKRIELLHGAQGAVFPIIHPALGVLPEIHHAQPVDVLLGGEFADEVVGTLALLSDWAVHTSVRALVEGGRTSWPTGTYRDLARWGKRRLLNGLGRVQMPLPGELPPLVATELRAEYAEWLAGQRRHASADHRPLRALALSTRQDPFVVMNWEGASPLGIRRSLPFFNREAIELAFSCHPGEQLGPGTKKLLRSAVRGDVPAENLNRQDKGTSPAPDLDLPWRDALDVQLAPIVRPDWFPRPPERLDHMDAWRLAGLGQIAHSRRAAIRARERADHAA